MPAHEPPSAGAFSPGFGPSPRRSGFGGTGGGKGGPDHREAPDDGKHAPVHGLDARGTGAGKPLHCTRNGVVAGCDRYRPLRAFSQGGCYWDSEPQRLLRSGVLGEFLPKVEWVESEQGRAARFYCGDAGRDRLGRSRPLGSSGVQANQIDRLRQALVDLGRKATDSETQPQNRAFIAGFCLPDIARAPELFRVTGPFWNRQLHILWGCEPVPGASLPALLALKKLPVDRACSGQRHAVTVSAILLIAGLIGALAWFAQSTSTPVSSPTDHAPVAVAELSAVAPGSTPIGNANTQPSSVDVTGHKVESSSAPNPTPPSPSSPSQSPVVVRPTPMPPTTDPADWWSFGWPGIGASAHAQRSLAGPNPVASQNPPNPPNLPADDRTIAETVPRRELPPETSVSNIEPPPVASADAAPETVPAPPPASVPTSNSLAQGQGNRRHFPPTNRFEHGAERLMRPYRNP